MTSDCECFDNIVTEKWFTLPPAMEYYYRMHNADYKTLPPFRPDCTGNSQDVPLQIIYPENGAKIYLPKGLDSQTQAMVIEATCRNPKDPIFWHLDNDYVTTTTSQHSISIKPSAGKHVVTITDSDANSYQRSFEIIDK